ncbi:Uncharacterised protein [Legionella sainthelensi]|uniref:hypothetical protein n=1 Tax=Legionella sainthelensi TaxID=28087 RepID=UPI000F6DA6B6|nr:hypothetical protein [Legionella sainthelensi]VEB36754.1 Uncharacterised protein [Legionella sainthelensi]
MNSDIELNAMGTINQTSSNEMNTTEQETHVDPQDVSKYKKISAFIPKLITTIEQLEKLDQNTEMNIDLKKSRKRLSSIATENPNPNADDIEEFINVLSSALYGLSTGLRIINIEEITREKKNQAVDLLADIALIQEDIAKLAS